MFKIDHDLHNHSGLSLCSADPKFSAQHILDHAVEAGYKMIALTNHTWDALIPGATPYYQQQGLDHIKKALPLPSHEGIKFLFGCETEYCGGDKLALHPSHYDDYDIIIVPTNHFSGQIGLVCAEELDTTNDWMYLQIERLEELLKIDLPYERVGIAHLQWFEADKEHIPSILAHEKRYYNVFKEYANRGAGIELNASTFKYTDPNEKEAYEALNPRKKYSQCVSYDKMLWLFSIAKDAGCKFYVGSDSHTSERLDWPKKYLPRIIKDLGLTENDKFVPAERS